jgi:hypothetical protein
MEEKLGPKRHCLRQDPRLKIRPFSSMAFDTAEPYTGLWRLFGMDWCGPGGASCEAAGSGSNNNGLKTAGKPSLYTKKFFNC